MSDTCIVLIDGKNMLYRHHFVGRLLTRDDGHPTGAIHGCLNSLASLSNRLPDASFVWVWDGDGDTWRHKVMAGAAETTSFDMPDDDEELDDDFVNTMVTSSMSFLGINAFNAEKSRAKKPKKKGYKGQRVQATMQRDPKDKYPTDEKSRAIIQIPVLRLILRGIGIRECQVHGLECDDLIAMLAKRIFELDKHADVIIHSGDKDFYQLLPDVRIMTRLQEGKLQWVNAEDVLERFGVSVVDWVKYRALTGDSSDNIPHLWKVGPKTAKRMLDHGLDASEPDYRKLDPSCFTTFARYFQPHGPEKLWGAVHGNYILSKLVSDIDSPFLSDSVKKDLSKLFDKLDSVRRFRSRQSVKTTENYRKVNFLLAQYELNEVMGRLDELWQIR